MSACGELLFSLPPPPKLEGPLKLNAIKDPQYILKGKIRSPESIYVEGSKFDNSVRTTEMPKSLTMIDRFRRPLHGPW